MTTGTVPEDVRAYLSSVRARLDDLPAEEREDLLADVEPSVLESAGESDEPVELRLGPPDRFADELRAAAGLAPRAGAVPVAPAPRPTLRQRMTAAGDWVASSPDAGWLRDLAPLWWALRGYVAVGLVATFYDTGFGSRYAGTSVFGAGAFAVAVAVIVSVAIGLRRPRRSALVVVVNLVLILATPPVVANTLDAGRAAVLNDGVVSNPATPVAPQGVVFSDGVEVQNLYAFDRRGRLLHDVRLYDQDGEPLDVGAEAADPDRRTVEDRAGNVASNAFPIRYFEPGTRRVADPDAGAPRSPGPLAGRPLKERP